MNDIEELLRKVREIALKYDLSMPSVSIISTPYFEKLLGGTFFASIKVSDNTICNYLKMHGILPIEDECEKHELCSLSFYVEESDYYIELYTVADDIYTALRQLYELLECIISDIKDDDKQ